MKIFYLLMISALWGWGLEPKLALLKSVPSNGLQVFRFNQQNVVCQPYGVLTLEELMKSTLLPETCKSMIQKIFRRHPYLIHYGESVLVRNQRYHVEPVDERCIVYASGTKTYAEMLIRNGLAMRKPLLRDKIWFYHWDKAQKFARRNRKGVWNFDVWNNCANNLYESEEDQ